MVFVQRTAWLSSHLKGQRLAVFASLCRNHSCTKNSVLGRGAHHESSRQLSSFFVKRDCASQHTGGGFCSRHGFPAAPVVLRSAPSQFLRGVFICGCVPRGAGTWARMDGRRPRAVVVHPRLPGDREELVAWDAAEALAIAKALGWRVSNNDESESESEGSTDGEEDEDDVEMEDNTLGDRALAVEVAEQHITRIDRLDPRFFFHISEVGRIAVRVALSQSDILFVNAALSPTQQRHLEAAMDLAGRAARRARTSSIGSSSMRGKPRALPNEDCEHGDVGSDAGVALFDRNRAVIAIFARSASSPIARLRIELAEAEQAKARLGAAAVQGVATQLQRVADALARRIRGCSRDELLARSGGSRGVSTSFQSSPQITRQKQQRAVEERERRLREEVSRLRMHRATHRRRRGRLMTVGLIGYTNVGKSAIVNRLTGSDLLVRDGVFVTLDTAARRIALPSGAECYVLDSVGLVRDLPFELCDAFQATIEELQAADVVLHVRDLSHPLRDQQNEVVIAALRAGGIDLDRRVMEIWNKSDLLSPRDYKHFSYIRKKQDGTPLHAVSALQGTGFDDLLEALDEKLQSLSSRSVPGLRAGGAHGAIEAPGRRSKQRVRIPLSLSTDNVAQRWSFLYEHCSIVEDSISADDDATVLEVWMDDVARSRCVGLFGHSMLV